MWKPVMAVVDWAMKRPEVDKARFGTYGISGGTTGGSYAPAALTYDVSKAGSYGTLATDTGVTATIGSVRIKQSRVEGSVVNHSKTKKTANIAAGSGNKAVTGTVDAE